MDTIETVNVVEYINDSISSIKSWSDDPKGNKQAEEHYTACLKENDEGISDEDIQACLDNGYGEIGNYQVSIVHSTL